MPKKLLDAALYITKLPTQYLVLNNVKPLRFSSKQGLSEDKQESCKVSKQYFFK